MNKSMLDLYKKLDLQERREKRKSGQEREFIFFPFSLSFTFFYGFSHVNILLYLRFKMKLYYSNFRIFLLRPSCLQWSTLLSASLRRLFRNL